MTSQTIIYLALSLAVCANLLLGLLVITRNGHDALNRCFLALVIAVGGWVATNAAFLFVTSASLRFVIALLSYAFASALAVCFYLFSIILVVDVYKEKQHLKTFLVVFGIVMGLLSLVPNVVASGVHGTKIITNGLFLGLYGISILLLLARCVYVWVQARRRYKAQARNRMNVILIGFTMSALVGLFCNLLLPLNGDYRYVAIGPAGSLFFVAATALAIIRTSLFDVHFFVLRAAAYLSTLFMMTFIFITPFVLGVSFLLGQRITPSQLALVIFLSVCLLYVLQSLRRFFDQLTAKIFFRRYYDPQDVLDRLSDVLVRTADLDVLRSETMQILKDALRPSTLRYALFTASSGVEVSIMQHLDDFAKSHNLTIIEADQVNLNDAGLASRLRTAGIALAAKLHTTHEDLGYIVLGHKQSGELYNERDKRLLAVAADEIAISLQNALRFEQIQRFNVTLQEEVDTATRKLRRQNKKLEELDNIKDDFISMASHQLRTPLTSVKGYLSMVLEGDAGKLTHDQNMMLKQAFASSQRMVFLITDLLNVSRLKTGKFVIDAAPTNLKHVVEQELAQLRETAAAKSLELTYKPPKTFPELMLDEVKIRQVIMNYVDNAIYYTPSGGRIKVELAETPTTVELRVIDNGIGVPRDEQHHLFTKFYRATNARTARPDGTGLGLFMAQKVIAAQGGSIIFESKEGKGSTFGFSFSKSRLAEPTLPSSSGGESKALASALADAR